MSRCLSDRSIDHVVLERREVANSWRTERWDSLRLLTPNWQCRLPGYAYSGDDPDGFMTMPEVVEFITGYARDIAAPLQTGTTVKFQMTKGSYEAHTATFGPGNIEDPQSFLGSLAASFESPAIDPRGVYPSDVTPVSLSPTTHGNGFWNSGVLDAVKGSPLPESSSVKFDTPGTYTYYCLIHPFMRGTVTVQ